MMPFDINEVNPGDVLPTKDGNRKVKILCIDSIGRHPIVGQCVENKQTMEFTSKGNYQWSYEGDDDLDLMLNDYKESIDVHVYRSKSTKRLTISTIADHHNENYQFIKKVTIYV